LRYFIQLAYRGSRYHGWQIQSNALSVQAELNRALQTILRHPVETAGSGRTDTGVHAEEQFAHLDTDADLTNAQLLFRLNTLLPPDIAVRNIFRVGDSAHARFDAVSRSYQYRITYRKNPFLEKLAYFHHRTPDVARMNEAASRLLSYTDFQSFSRVHTEVNHFHCTITEARWIAAEDGLVFRISANRFLRGMVRALVGTLLEVGEGRLGVKDFEEIIQARDRKKAGRAVPPEGLFMTRVLYPPEIGHWQQLAKEL
jgi:tRNA pseudouridine38-40 synthase